mmetsp:Transcript_18204/g.29656  ORF Transcript_18204/g.29656 Transcript_18204/m.29656 type:complete len:185 (+) Transcript_18204:77-631(+)
MSRLPYSYVGVPLGKESFAKVNVEVFLDFFCPFSVKATPTMVQLAKLDNVAVRVVPFPQPWHWEGGVIATAFNIVLKNHSAEAAAKYFVVLMQNYAKFKEEGKNMSVGSMVKMAHSLTSGIVEMKEDDFLTEFNDSNSPGVLRQLKNQIKYGRQNGIHETPTFMVNGTIAGAASSSWDMTKWKE